MSFRDLKVGDRVNRFLGGEVRMLMEVEEVRDDVVVCSAVQDDGSKFKGGWEFHRDHGCEEDEALRWGARFGATGSFIRRLT